MTGLDDERHVAFAGQFGELDDVTPYTLKGKKHRLPFDQLFDVSNLEGDGSIAEVTSHRSAMNKVGCNASQNPPVAQKAKNRETHYSTLIAPSTQEEAAIPYFELMSCHRRALEALQCMPTLGRPSTSYLRT